MCTVCGTRPRSIAIHLSTATHRRATRTRFTGRRLLRARPDWSRSLAGDPYAVTDAEELAAARRLGLADWSI